MLKNLNDKKIILINIGVFIVYIFWSFLLPFNQGPDEYMRNEVIKGMIQLKRIVIVGDIDVYYGPWGFNYSYLLSNLPYIMAMLLNELVDKILSIPIYWYGRIISLLCGYYANILFYKLLRLIFDKKENNIELLIFAFWPQVVFMYIYTNADSISIMLSVGLMYYTMLGLKTNWSKDILIKLSIIVGFSILSYYYLYSVILGMFVVFFIDFTRKKTELKRLIIPTCIVVLIVFPFILRNYILYKDVFGLNTIKKIGEQLAIEDLKPSLRNTYYFQGKTILSLILGKEWLLSTLKSYIGGVGYMEHFLPETFYWLYLAIVGMSTVNLKKLFIFLKRKKMIIYFIGILLSIIINIILFIHYNYYSDYQPQGRYLLSSAPGVILIVILLLKQFKNKFLLNFLAYLNIVSVFYFISIYLNTIINKQISFKVLGILASIIIILEILRKLKERKKMYILILAPLLIFAYFFNFKNLSLGAEKKRYKIKQEKIEYLITYKKNIGGLYHIKLLSKQIDQKVLIIENKLYTSIKEFDTIKQNEKEQQFLIYSKELKKDSKINVGKVEGEFLKIDNSSKVSLETPDIDLEKNNLNLKIEKLMKNIQDVSLVDGNIYIDNINKTKDFLIFRGWGIIKGIDSDETEIFLEVVENDKIINMFSAKKEERKDVTNHFKNKKNYDKSGFSIRVEKKFLRGKKINIIVLDLNKNIYYRKNLKIEGEL